MSDYATFLQARLDRAAVNGIAPRELPDALYPFQHYLCEWALRLGRAAVFADCGLGKTPIQLVWADAVVQHTNKPVLILTPLAVSAQTVRASVSRSGRWLGRSK